MAPPPPPQQRHLKDLLEEEQEPFQYLTQLKPSIQNQQQSYNSHQQYAPSTFPSTSRRSACFFFSSSSHPKSPDHPYRRSPMFNNTFDALSSTLHVPPKTSALLLHAALRVHKHSKPRFRTSGLGLLGSLIRRLTNRTRARMMPETMDGVVRWATSANTSITSSSSMTSTTSCAGTVSQDELGEEDEVLFVNGFESPLQERQSPALSSPHFFGRIILLKN